VRRCALIRTPFPASSRYDGFVAKFMGDGVLAYFGYPRAHEDEAERAVRAGLEIEAAVTRLETRGTEPLAVRIGIATGLVVVGDLVGEGSAQEQAVVGETPNLAARLQALAEPGQIVIAGTTRRLIADLFRLRDLGRQAVKGVRPDLITKPGLIVHAGGQQNVSCGARHTHAGLTEPRLLLQADPRRAAPPAPAD
jgi:hypothetical protein